MANEVENDCQADRGRQTNGRINSQRPRRNRSREVVTVRQSGTRYPTQSELRIRRVQDKSLYGVTRRKIFIRFIFSLILLVLVGIALLVFGFSFISQAKKFQDEEDSSLPTVFCVLAMVLGILMHLGALVLAHYIITHKLWRKSRLHTGSRRRASSSTQALHRADSTSSLSPPDLDGAPPLYSVSQQHALAPAILHLIPENPHLASPNGSTMSPDLLFVLPSYEDIVNQKVPPGGDHMPPAYCENSNERTEQSPET